MKEEQKAVRTSVSVSPQREAGNTPRSVKIAWWKCLCSSIGYDTAVLTQILNVKLEKKYLCSFQSHPVYRAPDSTNLTFDDSLGTLLDHLRFWYSQWKGYWADPAQRRFKLHF